MHKLRLVSPDKLYNYNEQKKQNKTKIFLRSTRMDFERKHDT